MSRHEAWALQHRTYFLQLIEWAAPCNTLYASYCIIWQYMAMYGNIWLYICIILHYVGLREVCKSVYRKFETKVKSASQPIVPIDDNQSTNSINRLRPVDQSYQSTIASPPIVSIDNSQSHNRINWLHSNLSNVVVVAEWILAVVVFPQKRYQQIQRFQRCAPVSSSHVGRRPDLM